MPTMYKDGSRPCLADKSQVEAMKKAGWSLTEPKAQDVVDPNANKIQAQDGKTTTVTK